MLLALFAGLPITALPAGRASNLQYGAFLYAANCRACHGDAGSGGLAPALAGPGKAAGWDFQRFRAVVLGDYLRHVSGVMPHFGMSYIAPTGKPPTNAELRTIQRYLASVKS